MLGLSELLSQVPKKYETIIVDGFPFDDQGRLLMQRRSMNRKLFPGFWDAIGGHLEHGESIEEGLRREMREETSMDLVTIEGLVNRFEWASNPHALNLQFVCRATGTPVPEEGKVTELRWISRADLDDLHEWLTPEMKKGALAAFDFLRHK